jgi:hypothetical protein
MPVDSFSLYILTLKGRDKLVGILGVVIFAALRPIFPQSGVPNTSKYKPEEGL